MATKKKPRPTRKRRPVGRPRKVVAENDIQRLERLAGLGFTVPMLAASVGMGETVFRERLKADPKISEALEKGKAVAAEKVGTSLFRRAISGKDTTATIWYEKSRLGMSERHTVEHTHVKREDVIRVMTDMARVVEKYVLDEETRGKIRRDWLSLRLA